MSEYCEVCGHFYENCICLECPLCGQCGDPSCWVEVDLGVCGGLFGKPRPHYGSEWEQLIAKAEYQQEK